MTYGSPGLVTGGAHEDWHKSRPLVLTYVRPGGPADRYCSCHTCTSAFTGHTSTCPRAHECVPFLSSLCCPPLMLVVWNASTGVAPVLCGEVGMVLLGWPSADVVVKGRNCSRRGSPFFSPVQLNHWCCGGKQEPVYLLSC